MRQGHTNLHKMELGLHLVLLIPRPVLFYHAFLCFQTYGEKEDANRSQREHIHRNSLPQSAAEEKAPDWGQKDLGLMVTWGVSLLTLQRTGSNK